MEPNREPKRTPYGSGGYESEIVEVGPPRYWTPPAPDRLRASGRRKRRVPLVPARVEIEALPRWAKVAFAARCAGRLIPALEYFWPTENARGAVGRAVRLAEFAAAHAALDPAAAADTVRSVRAVSREIQNACASAGASAAAHALDAALRAADSDLAADGTSGVAEQTAKLLFDTATTDTPLTAQLRCIRRDFARLKRLAREHKWTDDTPVPPDVFGPMWPAGVAPYWAVEPPPAPAMK